MNRMLLALGVLVILAGVVAQNYAEVTTQGGVFGDTQKTTFPYQPFAIPLGVGGAVMAIIGLVLKQNN